MTKTIIRTLIAVMLIALFIPFVVNKDSSVFSKRERYMLQIGNSISTDELQFVKHPSSAEKEISEIFIPNTNQKIKISVNNGEQLLNNGGGLTLVAVFKNFFGYEKFYLPIDLITQEKERLKIGSSDIEALVDYKNTEYMMDGICNLFSDTQPCIFDGELIGRIVFIIRPSNIREMYKISVM